MSYGGVYDSPYYGGGGVYSADPRWRQYGGDYGYPAYGYSPYSRPSPSPYSVYPSRAPMVYSSFAVHDTHGAPERQVHFEETRKQPVIVEQPVPPYGGRRSYCGHLVLAFIVIFLFGNPLFGLAALVLALVADSMENTSHAAAVRLAKSSVILSVVGIIISILVVTIYLVLAFAFPPPTM